MFETTQADLQEARFHLKRLGVDVTVSDNLRSEAALLTGQLAKAREALLMNSARHRADVRRCTLLFSYYLVVVCVLVQLLSSRPCTIGWAALRLIVCLWFSVLCIIYWRCCQCFRPACMHRPARAKSRLQLRQSFSCALILDAI